MLVPQRLVTRQPGTRTGGGLPTPRAGRAAAGVAYSKRTAAETEMDIQTKTKTCINRSKKTEKTQAYKSKSKCQNVGMGRAPFKLCQGRQVNIPRFRKNRHHTNGTVFLSPRKNLMGMCWHLWHSSASASNVLSSKD